MHKGQRSSLGIPKMSLGTRTHNYARPVAGIMLITVDAFSKWLEVKVTNSTRTAATIAILDESFLAYGVPVTIVSDNNRQFVAAEFETFLQTNGIKYHKLTAPYHLSTNGQAERYVNRQRCFESDIFDTRIHTAGLK